MAIPTIGPYRPPNSTPPRNLPPPGTPSIGPYRPPSADTDPEVHDLDDIQCFRMTYRGWIPGLETYDQALAHAWMQLHVTDYDCIWFNVRLYVSTPQLLNLPDRERLAALVATARRVDAVARRSGQHSIIEFSQATSPEIIGRIETYRTLFVEQFPTHPLEAVILVASKFWPWDTTTLDRLSIQRELVAAQQPL